MKNNLLNSAKSFTAFILFLLLIPNANFAQAPDLGSASGFVLFTSAGSFTADGASTVVTGDVGTNVGAFSAFPPGVLVGSSHVADGVSPGVATDVSNAYGTLAAVTCGSVISTTLGNGQTLLPNVYCMGAASTINGDLILDGQGDPTSLFIFEIDGALATTVNSRIILTNSASLCNVYWRVNGQVDLGENSLFQGTILANGAINLLDGAKLLGRGLSQAGAISLHNNIVTIGFQPTASTITADGPVTFCAGESVTLSGNIDGTWNTGATTGSITVNTGGDYFITNTTGCGSVNSTIITVTVNPLPVCTISGNLSICPGGSTQLCAPSGTGFTYSWNTGETTSCIEVSTGGTYSVTVTNENGCTSTCSQEVTVTPAPVCSITGSSTICHGSSTQLCAPSGTGYTYKWSNDATTNCVTVSEAGIYSVTVTTPGGCTSTCSITVVVTPAPSCIITGSSNICQGGSTQLCAPSGTGYTYKWSNDATTNCISVSAAGVYSVTVTTPGGCISTCSITVTLTPVPSCIITGNSTICQGGSTQLCVASETGSTYKWSNNATTNCITVSAAGTYSVTVTNANGCTSTCSKTITVTPVPSCSITGNSTICQGGSTQLCVASETGSTYKWSNNATTNCITVSAAGTYSVTVTNANGCTSTCSKTITVAPGISCSITGTSTVCQGGTTQLCAPAGCAKYKWSTGATTSCITVGAGTYTLTVTSAGGCTSTCSKTVTTVPGISCSITGNSTVCEGGTTQLCAPAGCAKYKWSTGATTSCITVGAGTYTLTVTNAGGCTSTCTKTVTTVPGISCSITGNSTVCQGGTTQLCAPAGCAKYKWSTGATTSCITVGAGTYTLTVTNAGGCTSTCTKTVTTVPGISCSITGNSTVCQGGTTQLCAPAGCAKYKWSTGATTSCITVGAGTYTLTVTNAGGCTSTCTKTVTTVAGISCSITGNSTVCQGGTTQLCAPAGCAKYKWSTGATTSCITAGAGTYTLTVTNAGGCTSTCSKTVTVTSPLSCTITGDLHPNPGKTTVLSAPPGLSSYKWSTGATTSSITVTCSGTYTVTAKNSSGCSSSCSACVTYASSLSSSFAAGDKIKISDVDENFKVNAYPNPFTSKAVIEFKNNEKGSHILIELFDMAGTKIATLFNQNVKKGVLYKAEINAGNLSSGLYTYRILSGGKVIIKKIMLQK